ncbi:MAG: energy-coupling factor transporter transmembrane protein EcfT [Clostridia bacterium]|nr:energy-coupling factor transporter transmembrane protein EcfT [Clostridia bacterium]
MFKDITLGQYFPGNSFLHKLDPRMKLVLAVFYIVLIFLAKSAPAYALVFLFTVLLIAVSGISFITVLKSLKPIFLVLIFTTLINIFWNNGTTVLFEWKFIVITLEGIIRAITMALRIILLMVSTSVILMYTTSPIALTDGLEQLLSPLAKIKIPVHTFAMMMTMALRFIPTLLEETQKIINAQKARGADFDSGNIITKAKALIPVLIPLLISQFRRAEELATAMECRCYRGGGGRTRMTILHFSVRDFISAGLVLALFAGILLLNFYFPALIK